MDSLRGIWAHFLLPLFVLIAGTTLVSVINEIPAFFKNIIILLIFVVVVYYIPKNTKFRSIPVRQLLFLLVIILELAAAISLILVPDKTIEIRSSTDTQYPKIEINYTSNTANIEETITGTAENVPERYELWILIYPYAASKYYPQPGGVSIQNGVWSTPVYIGTRDNVGEKFDIIAVLADRNARAEFTSYIINGEKNNDWPGMDKIPDGAEAYDIITVVREYEKTTVTRETPEAPTQIRIPDLLQIITNISAILASAAAICGTYLAYRTK